MDYKETLLMNKSNFEMRGNLAQKEPILVEKWKAENLYEEMNQQIREKMGIDISIDFPDLQATDCPAALFDPYSDP